MAARRNPRAGRLPRRVTQPRPLIGMRVRPKARPDGRAGLHNPTPVEAQSATMCVGNPSSSSNPTTGRSFDEGWPLTCANSGFQGGWAALGPQAARVVCAPSTAETARVRAFGGSRRLGWSQCRSCAIRRHSRLLPRGSMSSGSPPRLVVLNLRLREPQRLDRCSDRAPHSSCASCGFAGTEAAVADACGSRCRRSACTLARRHCLSPSACRRVIARRDRAPCRCPSVAWTCQCVPAYIPVRERPPGPGASAPSH